MQDYILINSLMIDFRRFSFYNDDVCFHWYIFSFAVALRKFKVNSGIVVSHPGSYPHKTAYYHFAKPQDVHQIWEDESKEHLSLYLHIPFCTQRSLHNHRFAIVNPDPFLVKSYLQTLQRQAAVYRKEIAPESFEYCEIGGGVPMFLNAPQLETMFKAISEGFEIDCSATTVACDVSPKNLNTDQLGVLKANHVDHAIVPIQSFRFDERRQLGIVVSDETIYKSLTYICNAKFPSLAFELNYGIESQTQESWAMSLKEAVQWNPTEIAIYPIDPGKSSPFVRPESNLEMRLKMYRIARMFLLQSGYTQISSRCFCLKKLGETTQSVAARRFNKGLIGIGAGARSRTTHWLYSSEYASDRKRSVEILENYVHKSKLDFKRIDYGFELSVEEQKRRQLIFSLLQTQGLSRAAYKQRFSTDVLADFTEIPKLQASKLATITDEHVVLTEHGLERSDQIAMLFQSKNVKERIRLNSH